MKTPSIAHAALIVALWTACAEPPDQRSSEEPAASRPAVPRPAAPRPEDDGPEVFLEAAARSGLEFTHFNGMTGGYSYPEMMGSGAALFDYDGDGDLDVYLVQGNLLASGAAGRGASGRGAADAVFPPDRPLPLTDRLFRNDLTVSGDTVSGEGEKRLSFTDVTKESGLAATGYGMGAVAADFDGDGLVDVYVTNLGANQMWRNEGPGADGRVTFSDVTAASGTGDARWSVAAAAVDVDRDGRLDLYVGNYVEWSASTEPSCTDELGMANYCGPLAFEPAPDTLYLNRGAPGRPAFEDASHAAGIRAEYGGALGVVAADFDGDGWPDLYVGNDGLPNQLWMNRGDGTFENRALLAGCAVNAAGRAEASMGLSAADFDGDGDEDLFLTHLDMETNTVYVNDGGGHFADRSVETGLGSPSWSFTGFGTAWFDYDNDGWLDVLTANGAVKVLKAQALAGDPLPLRQKNQLFRNRGGGSFEEVTARAGAAFGLEEVSRGAAFGDLDNDGDTDAVVTNNSGPVRLLVNQVGQDRHWLGLRLVVRTPDGAPRDAWGARVTVAAGDGGRVVRRVGGAASYASSSDPRVLVGLGETTEVTSVRVAWSGGREEEWRDLEVDRYTTLTEGSGRPPAGGGQ